jgi:CspA family cold shock protein
MKLHKILVVLAVSILVAVMILASVSPALAAEKENGVVKWFDVRKGYGFIERHSGGTASVQSSAIEDLGGRPLEEGDPVEFTVEEGPAGPQATNVRRIA